MFSKRSLGSWSKKSYPTEFTHVIVGAGSAGCVLANRLTEDPNRKVLLLEAGPKDMILNSYRMSWKIHMPAALTYNLKDKKYNWYYHTTPQKYVNNRVMYWPRGKVWGGSSSLNAMVYIRGHALDYNRWEEEDGALGWRYDNVLPYFKKAQTHELGEDDYRGGSGPLRVCVGSQSNPLVSAFIDAAMQAGYPYTSDMNGFQQEGVGPMDMTVYDGKRWSTASAYLRPALKRPNLFTKVKCLTTKILFDGDRAIGVEYVSKGKKSKVYATEDVVLSGGAINSPQLLMMSGVGNAEDLDKLKIPVKLDLPGVGENLQDHLELYIQHYSKKPITLHSAQQPLKMVQIGLEWFWRQTGLGASAHLHSGGFIRSGPGVSHPDIQFHFLPSQVVDHGRAPSECHAFQVHVGSMRATSRGFLKLSSNNPIDHPIIEPNYLETETDRWELRQCVKLTREIFAQSAFDEFRGKELRPGVHIQSDEEIDGFVRQWCDSAYHPCGTCKMGPANNRMAVVDNETRVHGLKNLRVIDASIMPSIVSGNLNAPTIMIAEKAADMIRGKKALLLPESKFYVSQRIDMQR